MELQQVLNNYQKFARCACNHCLTKDQPVTVRIQGTERRSWGDQVEAVRPLPPPPPVNDRMRRDVKVEDRELGPPRSPTTQRKPAYPLASVPSEMRRSERKKIYGRRQVKTRDDDLMVSRALFKYTVKELVSQRKDLADRVENLELLVTAMSRETQNQEESESKAMHAKQDEPDSTTAEPEFIGLANFDQLDQVVPDIDTPDSNSSAHPAEQHIDHKCEPVNWRVMRDMFFIIGVILMILSGLSGCMADSKSDKLIPEYGTLFNHKGVAIMNTDSLQMVFNISMEALNWTVPPPEPIVVPSTCEQTHTDMRVLCEQFLRTFNEHAESYNLFVDNVNELLTGDLKIATKGELQLRPMQKAILQNVSDSSEEFLNHVANLTKIEAPAERFINWNWKGKAVTFLWEVILRNGTERIASRYAANGPLPLKWTFSFPELEGLESQYLAQWPTLHLTQIEWETINALKSQRVNERIPGFIAKVDNVRTLFENIKTRFKKFITKSSDGRDQLNMQAISAAKRRTEFSRQWITMRAKMVVLFNLYTRQVFREMVPIFRSMYDKFPTERMRSMRNWAQVMATWWDTVEMSKDIKSQKDDCPEWQWEKGQLRMRDQINSRPKRQAVAIGIGIAALIAAAADSAAIHWKMGSMSSELNNVEKWQKDTFEDMTVMQNNDLAIAQTTLKLCDKLRKEISANRQAINDLTKEALRSQKWEKEITHEIVHLHEMVHFVSTAFLDLQTLMSKDIWLRNLYLGEVRELIESIAHLEMGYLTPNLVSPMKLTKALKAVQENTDRKWQNYEVIFSDPDIYYQRKVNHEWTKGSLMVSVSIPIQKNSMIYHVYEVESIHTPITQVEKDQKGTKSAFTKLQIDSPFFMMNDNQVAKFSREEMQHCEQMGLIYLCNEPMAKHEPVEETCLGALYLGLRLEEIKNKCKFSVTYGKQNPEMLRSETQTMISGLTNEWRLLCSSRNWNDFGTFEHSTIVVNNSLFCECEIRGEKVRLQQSIAFCADSGSVARIQPVTNLAIGTYFLEETDLMHASLQNWRMHDQFWEKRMLLSSKAQKLLPEIKELATLDQNFTLPLNNLIEKLKKGKDIFWTRGLSNLRRIQGTERYIWVTQLIKIVVATILIMISVAGCVLLWKMRKKVQRLQVLTLWKQIMYPEEETLPRLKLSNYHEDPIAPKQSKRNKEIAKMLASDKLLERELTAVQNLNNLHL